MSAEVSAGVARAEAEIRALTPRLRPHVRRGVGHRHVCEFVRSCSGRSSGKNGSIPLQDDHRISNEMRLGM